MRILFLLCILSFTIHAQDHPQPDRWRGLILGQSTPEDAIKLLGAAKSDKMQGIYSYPLNQRLSLDHNSKGFRRLDYGKLDGIKEASLIFQDNKLVLIEIKPDKKIRAGSLGALYGLQFAPKFPSALGTPIGGRDVNGMNDAQTFPMSYYLIAKSESTYVSAQIQQGVFSGSGGRREKISADDQEGYPGTILKIQLISLTLEKHEGGDVLK